MSGAKFDFQFITLYSLQSVSVIVGSKYEDSFAHAC